MKGKNTLLITNIRLNNVNPNGENIVANNLNHANCQFLKIFKIEFKYNHHMIFLCHHCLQNKTLHIIHLTYED